MRHVFVIGLDDFNGAVLRSTADADDRTIHGLLEREEVRERDEFDFDEMVAHAEAGLGAAGVEPDAICSFWDFPVAEMVPTLAGRHGVPSASLESVVRMQHKYWSRMIQAGAVPEATPEFCAVDPFEPRAASRIPLEYPFWLKPVRSFRSYLAFQVRNDYELDEALEQIRAEIPRLAAPYQQILRRITVPDEIAGVDGSFCIAERRIGGRQCTLEGYVYDGEPVIYGIVDSVRAPNGTSFRRYEYPSRLPSSVQRRMIRIATEAVRAMDYDGAPFNLELFWDRPTDRIWLLEVNARQSQSHAPLFERVDGVSNHQVMVDLALGERPTMPHRRGGQAVAAKWFLRAWHDGIVSRVPTELELAALHDRFPDMSILLHVAAGDHLADLADQDSYSYELGVVFAGASSQRELLDQHRALLAVLPLEIRPLR